MAMVLYILTPSISELGNLFFLYHTEALIVQALKK